jgi:hypothetical protein
MAMAMEAAIKVVRIMVKLLEVVERLEDISLAWNEL